jgi:hypothetical protein
MRRNKGVRHCTVINPSTHRCGKYVKGDVEPRENKWVTFVNKERRKYGFSFRQALSDKVIRKSWRRLKETEQGVIRPPRSIIKLKPKGPTQMSSTHHLATALLQKRLEQPKIQQTEEVDRMRLEVLAQKKRDIEERRQQMQDRLELLNADIKRNNKAIRQDMLEIANIRPVRPIPVNTMKAINEMIIHGELQAKPPKKKSKRNRNEPRVLTNKQMRAVLEEHPELLMYYPEKIKDVGEDPEALERYITLAAMHHNQTLRKKKEAEQYGANPR